MKDTWAISLILLVISQASFGAVFKNSVQTMNPERFGKEIYIPAASVDRASPGFLPDSADRKVSPLVTGSVNQPAWNKLIAITEIGLVRSLKGESTMNNLICDIMLDRTAADFAFINYSDVYADLESDSIRNLDLFRLIPFNRTLVIATVKGRFLQELVEYNISGLRQGMAIGGGKLEWDASRPSLHRLNYFQVGDYPCYPEKEYKIVTTDYLADGNAGFTMLTTLDPAYVIRTGILLRDAVREFLQLHSPLSSSNVKLDGRWEKNTSATP